MKDAKFFVGVKALIRNSSGLILILKSGALELQSTKRTKPFWDLPGGKIRFGENVEQALKREVSEELRISKKNLKINEIFDASVSKIKISHGEAVPLLLVTFLCGLTWSEQLFKLSGEHSRFRWVSANEAKKLLSAKFNSTFLEKL